MTDNLSAEDRSRCMSHIRSRGMKPERAVRSIVHRAGYRFRLHRRDLPGKPDVVLPKHRSVIFVHGCFWHGHQDCPRSKRPSSNVEFWNRKLDTNLGRDERNRDQLRMLGWSSSVIWECQTKSRDMLLRKLREIVGEF